MESAVDADEDARRIAEIHHHADRVGDMPLPEGLSTLSEEDTVCKFCGVSYLIHREVKRLQDRAAFLETQLSEFKADAAMARDLKAKLTETQNEARKARDRAAAVDKHVQYIRNELEQGIAFELTQVKVLKQKVRGELLALAELPGRVVSEVKPLIGRLGEALKEAQAERRTLENEVKLQGLQLADIPRLKAEIATLTSASEVIESERQQLRQALTAKEEAYKSLESAQEDSARIQKRLETEGAEARVELASLREALSSSTGELGTLLEKARAEKQGMEQANRELTSKLRLTEEERDALRSNVETLKREAQTQAATAHESQTTIEELSRDKRELAAMQTKLNEELLQLSNGLEEQEKKWKHSLHILQTDLDTKTQALAAIEADLEASRKQTDQYAALVQEMQSAKGAQARGDEAKLAEMKAVVADLKEKLRSQQQEAQHTLAIKHDEVSSLKQQLESAKGESEQLQGTIAQLAAKYKRHKADSAASIQQLREDVAKRDKEVEMLEHRLKAAVTDLDAASEIEGLRKAVDERDQEIAVLQDTVARECTERQDLVKALEAAREQALQLQLQRQSGRLPRASTSLSSTSNSSSHRESFQGPTHISSAPPHGARKPAGVGGKGSSRRQSAS